MLKRRKPLKRTWLKRSRKPIPKVSAKQRERLKNLAAIRKRWWDEDPYMDCGICGKPILSFEDLDSDHIEPGKMGGCRNDDESNLQPAHKFCNRAKGSQRNYKHATAVAEKRTEEHE